MLSLVVIFLGLAIAYAYHAWFDRQYTDGRTFSDGQTHQFVVGDNLHLYGGGEGAFKADQVIPGLTLEWTGTSH